MSTTTLPFNIMTNRILEQSGYSDIDLIKIADRKEISTAIKKAGFDASKSRVCIQEINDYFSKQDKKIKEDTAKIKSSQYLSPTASEVTAKRKKIIDNLFGKNSYMVLNSQEFDKLLLDFSISKTGYPVCEYVVRDSVKAMGYYYTTAIGTRQKGCYISKTKDSRDVVRRRSAKVLKSINKKPYDQVEKIRAEYINWLKSKEYVILDNIQLEDILIKLSSYEGQPLDTTTFRKLINDNNCCFITIDQQKYYYASGKYIYTRNDIFKIKQILIEELRKNPRVVDNFRDDIAKLLIHADIVYIKDFDGMEEDLLRELFKKVNYDEATIQKCLDAIHNYNVTWNNKNGNLVNVDNTEKPVTEEKKPRVITSDNIVLVERVASNEELEKVANSVPIKEEVKSKPPIRFGEMEILDDITPSDDHTELLKSILEESSKSIDEDKAEETLSIKIGDKVTMSHEEFKKMIEPKVPVKSDEMETSECIEVPHEQSKEEVENNGITPVEKDEKPSIDDIPTDPKQIKFEDSDIYNPEILLEKLRRLRLGNATAEKCLGFKMHQEKPQDMPKESMNTSYGQQTQQQLIPKMINPYISGTCPYCNNSFTVPATTTHRVYCFACGNLIQY